MKAILLRLRPARSRIMTMMSNADEAARIVASAGAARSMALRRLPVRQRVVRLRDRRIHDPAVLTGAGGQFDDIAVGIAEIDRPDKAVVDRPAHLSTLGLGLIQHRVEGLGLDPSGMCRSSESWRLKSKADSSHPRTGSSNPVPSSAESVSAVNSRAVGEKPCTCAPVSSGSG